MTLTSTRMGRLGAPGSGTDPDSGAGRNGADARRPRRRAAEPRSPMCRECTTDHYLKIRLFLPSARRIGRLSGVRRLVGRIIRSARPSGGRVEYFCQKCGTPQRHQIPEGWEPSVHSLTPCDVQDLSSVYIAPGESLPAQAVREQLLGPDDTVQEPLPRAEKTRAVRSGLLA